jgi:hypothetical protein
MATPRLATRARKALSAFGPADVLLDGLTVEVKVDSGPKGVTGIVRALDVAKLSPVRFIVREPTLDDVFLSLTGHVAEMPAETDAEEGAA